MSRILTYRSSSVSSTALAVSARKSALHAVQVINPGVSDAWLQLFDVAQGSVVVGTTAPTKSILIKAGTMQPIEWARPVGFDTALTIAAATTATGGTAPASALVVNIDYDE